MSQDDLQLAFDTFVEQVNRLTAAMNDFSQAFCVIFFITFEDMVDLNLLNFKFHLEF